MKIFRTIIFASSALALSACADLNEMKGGSGEEKQLMTIEASIDAPGTKTYMGPLDNSLYGANGGYPVLWSSGDKVALLSDSGISEFTIKADNGTTGPGHAVAQFEGNASEVVGTFPNTLVYPAAYPVEGAFAETFGGTVWVGSELPMIQTYVGTGNQAKGFSDNTYPMAAAAIDPAHYHFFNMAGIVRLKIYSSEARRISRITLKNNAHAPVSGKMAMAFHSETGEVESSTEEKDNGKLVKAYGTDGSENVIIDLSGITPDPAKPLETGIWLPASEANALEFNIAVIPQLFPKGFTVEIQDATNLGTSKWVANRQLTVKRSEILEMSTINFVEPEPLGIANCFLLSEAGEYLLPAYAYGNRLDIKIGLTNGQTDPDFDPENLDAAIYWTDIVDENGNKKDAVTNLKYLTFDNGINYMSFKLAKDPDSQSTLPDGSLDPDSGHPYRGNVVIALYNTNSKKIFWTWHMWLCDTPKDVKIDGACASGSYNGVYPDGTPLNYSADATSGQMWILDRNLGAVYATPEEAIEAEGVGSEWKTYGLYYQDGRKDPFIGGYYNGDIGLTKDLSTSYDAVVKSLHKFESQAFDRSANGGTHKTWTNPMFNDWRATQGNLTLTNSIRDPHNYSFDAVKTRQWTNCNDADNQSWMDAKAHGKTGLSFGGHEAYWNRTKTIMDPCPPGYSVLGERGGYFFKGNGTKDWRTNTQGHPGYGLMYSVYGNDIWWPAAGVRSCEGLMAGVGEYGFYFFYDHISANHGGHGVIFSLTGPSDGKFLTNASKDAVITNHATPVRCVKDKQVFSSSTSTPHTIAPVQ